MADISIFWLVATAICVGVGAVAVYRHGPGVGAGVGLAVACLMPTWTATWVYGQPIDVRLATAIALIGAYCFHSDGKIWSRINLIDIAVAGLVVWQVTVDWLHDGFGALVPLTSYLEWALPYLAGRFSVMHSGALASIRLPFACCAVVIACLALVESFANVNAWEMLFGPVDDLVKRGRGMRYDFLYRAMGPTRHPIFLGIVLMLMVPWAVSLIDSEGSRKLKYIGWLSLAGVVVGVLATVSRGPLLCLFLAAATALSYYSLWARRVFAVTIVLGAILAAVNWSSVVGFVESTGSINVRSRVVEVDGEAVAYTGSNNRLFVLEIYGPLVVRGGAMGFGTEATSSFPPNIPGLPVSARAQEVLGIVDNSYILIGLRLGIVGLAFFVLMLFASIYNAFSLARNQSLVTYPGGSLFLVALGSILLAVSVEILTVFSSYDFIFWLLFTCGVVSGLTALDRKIRGGEVQID